MAEYHPTYCRSVRFWPLSLAACVLPIAAHAGELELRGYAGSVFPFYEETFEFDPGQLSGLPPGVTLEQEDVFRLDAQGGLALGLAASWQFRPWLGVEARLDTADVRVRLTGARYLIRTDLPGPLPDLVSELNLGGGGADLRRLHPVSLNLRARTGGRTRAGVSAGISYLPSFRFSVTQDATFAPVAPFPGPITVARVTLDAEALPEDEDQGRVGVNAGAFAEVGLGSRLALVIEGRYFHFRRQTLTWGRPEVDPPLPVLGDTIVDEIAGRLDPAEFNPTFFQLTAGLGVRF
jgi:hypothetical protein